MPSISLSFGTGASFLFAFSIKPKYLKKFKINTANRKIEQVRRAIDLLSETLSSLPGKYRESPREQEMLDCIIDNSYYNFQGQYRTIVADIEILRFCRRIYDELKPLEIRVCEKAKWLLDDIAGNEMALRLLGPELLSSMQRTYEYDLGAEVHRIILPPWSDRIVRCHMKVLSSKWR